MVKINITCKTFSEAVSILKFEAVFLFELISNKISAF